MKALLAFIFLAVLPAAVLAEDKTPAPTVTLTQSELDSIIEARINQYAAQVSASKSNDAQKKINDAFAPTKTEAQTETIAK